MRRTPFRIRDDDRSILVRRVVLSTPSYTVGMHSPTSACRSRANQNARLSSKSPDSPPRSWPFYTRCHATANEESV